MLNVATQDADSSYGAAIQQVRAAAATDPMMAHGTPRQIKRRDTQLNTPDFNLSLLGWRLSPLQKGSPKNKAGWRWVPNSADVDNLESLTLAAAMLDALGHTNPNVDTMTAPSLPPVQPGTELERQVMTWLSESLPRLDPTRAWEVRRGHVITDFAQYAHLKALDLLVASDPNLRVSVGRDYLIRPDVTVAVAGTRLIRGHAFLHAAVSCKWTIRSDRVQNVRHEFNQMIRHRRGRQPHLVTVTAEPLPSRLASIARGTGEVDVTYHVAFKELAAAVDASRNESQQAAWREVVGQGRMRDFASIAEDFVLW